MKKAILGVVSFALLAISGWTFAQNSEYKVARIQAPIVLPDGRDWNGDTVTGSLVTVRSQAFIKPGKFEFKIELCQFNYLDGCREIFVNYTFLSYNGRNLVVRDPFGRNFNVTVLRESPLHIILPGNVNIQFKEVAYSGVDRHRDITKAWNVDEALREIEEGEPMIFPF